jgi:hypothetical protein
MVKNSFLKKVGKVFLFLIKIPYFIILGIVLGIKKFSKFVSEKNRKRKIKGVRESMVPKYEDFKVLKVISGDYSEWMKGIFESDSKIGIILGARGSGKTAFGMKFLENFHVKSKKKCFALGFKENDLPSWIRGVESVSEISNNSFVLIDEGGVLFNSRKSMSSANKMLSDLMLISRHKNISILFISQNSSNLEVNILRQADFLVLRSSSLLQKNFERKIIQKIYEKVETFFKKFKKDKGLSFIYSEDFQGFVSNPLPSFWKEELSKGFG